ncbi:hypothetical protein HN51_048842, partial [Arachis hypogaea]
QLLDAEILPLVVSISGRISSETPIHCEFSGLRGVIVEETAEQHFLKHNDAGSWIQDSALMLSIRMRYIKINVYHLSSNNMSSFNQVGLV